MSIVLKTRAKTRTELGNEFLYNRKPDSSNNYKKRVSNFFIERIKRNAQLATAETGLYTWILRSSGNFYAAKTITKQEVGTLHVNLKMLTELEDPSDIYAAGELELVAGPTVMFNLLSGTYMAPKFKKLSNSQKLLFRNEIIQKVMQVLNSFSIASQYLECSNITSCSEEERLGGMMLIEKANVRTSNTNLANLNKLFNRKYGGTKRKYIRRRKTMRKNRG